jgi:hypothetical protein
MRPFRNAVSCALLLAAAASTAAAAPSATRSFDGKWSVLIVTDQGTCDRAYRYGVSIVNGKLIYTGDAAVNVDGRVANNGAVRVSVSAGSRRANAAGRFMQRSGSGTWHAVVTSGTCSGTWSAERR